MEKNRKFFVTTNKTTNLEVISMVKKCLPPGHVGVKYNK